MTRDLSSFPIMKPVNWHAALPFIPSWKSYAAFPAFLGTFLLHPFLPSSSLFHRYFVSAFKHIYFSSILNLLNFFHQPPISECCQCTHVSDFLTQHFPCISLEWAILSHCQSQPALLDHCCLSSPGPGTLSLQ